MVVYGAVRYVSKTAADQAIVVFKWLNQGVQKATEVQQIGTVKVVSAGKFRRGLLFQACEVLRWEKASLEEARISAFLLLSTKQINIRQSELTDKRLFLITGLWIKRLLLYLKKKLV